MHHNGPRRPCCRQKEIDLHHCLDGAVREEIACWEDGEASGTLVVITVNDQHLLLVITVNYLAQSECRTVTVEAGDDHHPLLKRFGREPVIIPDQFIQHCTGKGCGTVNAHPASVEHCMIGLTVHAFGKLRQYVTLLSFYA